MLRPARQFQRIVCIAMSAVTFASPILAQGLLYRVLGLGLMPMFALAWSNRAHAGPAVPTYNPITPGQATSDGAATARASVSQVQPGTVDKSSGTVTVTSPVPTTSGTSFNVNDIAAVPTAGKAPVAAALSASAVSASKAWGSNMPAMLGAASGMNGQLLQQTTTGDWSDSYRTLRGSISKDSHPDLSQDPTFAPTKEMLAGKDSHQVLAALTGACVPDHQGVATERHVTDMRTCQKPGEVAHLPPPTCRARHDLKVYRTYTKMIYHAYRWETWPNAPLHFKFSTRVDSPMHVGPNWNTGNIEDNPCAPYSYITNGGGYLGYFWFGPYGYKALSPALRNQDFVRCANDHGLTYWEDPSMISDWSMGSPWALDGSMDSTVTIDPFTKDQYPNQSSLPPGHFVVLSDAGSTVGVWPDAWNSYNGYYVRQFPEGAINWGTEDNGYVTEIKTYDSFAGGLEIKIIANVIEYSDTVIQEPAGCVAQISDTCKDDLWAPSPIPLDQVSNNAWACGVDTASSGVKFDSPQGPITVSPAILATRLLPLYPNEVRSSANQCLDVTTRVTASCLVNVYDNPANTCKELEQNPKCSFVSSTCADPAAEVNTCPIFNSVYDCGTTTTLPGGHDSTCLGGPINCTGTQCIEPPPTTQNPNFAAAAAKLQAAQGMNSDRTCDVLTGNCTVFNGEESHCMVGLWGMQNCCDQPTGVSLVDYVKMVSYSYKIADKLGYIQTSGSATTAAGSDVATAGLETTSSEGAAEALGQPLMSAADSTYAESFGFIATDGGTEAAAATADSMCTAASDGASAFIEDAFPEAADSLVGESGALMSEAVSAVLGPLALAFLIYELAMLLKNILWKCGQDDFQNNVSRELKECHEIPGDRCVSKVMVLGQQVGCNKSWKIYCCFKSPLSRILNEQIKNVLGISWGDADNPNCSGFTMDQMQQVDWSRVDLSEWLDIMASSGLFTANTAQANTQYSMTNTTSLSSVGNSNTATFQDRTDSMSSKLTTADQVNAKLGQQLWGGSLPGP